MELILVLRILFLYFDFERGFLGDGTMKGFGGAGGLGPFDHSSNPRQVSFYKSSKTRTTFLRK